jgi:hypothetical protein
MIRTRRPCAAGISGGGEGGGNDDEEDGGGGNDDEEDDDDDDDEGGGDYQGDVEGVGRASLSGVGARVNNVGFGGVDAMAQWAGWRMRSSSLAPEQAPILMHPLGTSENAYTHALAPDQASVLTLPLGTLGTSENAR